MSYCFFFLWFPCVLILCADPSEHYVSSILIVGVLTPPKKMEIIECSETSAHKIKTPGNVQKKEYNVTPFVLYTSISSGERHSSSLSDINSFFFVGT